MTPTEVLSVQFKLIIVDSGGRRVRTLMESQILQPVTDFNLSSDYLAADGRNQLHFWENTLFDVQWNGSNEAGKVLVNGVYFVQAISINRINEQTIVTKAITLERPTLNIIQAMRLAPNPAKDQVAIWVKTPYAGMDVNVQVYTVAGELVARVHLGQREMVQWNIVNSRGEQLADGIYLMVVLARDPLSGQVERKVQKLAVLR